MNCLKYQLVFLQAAFLFSLTLPGLTFSETLQKKDENAEAAPVVIKSKTVEMNNELKLVTFSGDVNARRDDFVINCDKMVVYYESSPDKPEKGGGQTRVNKIVATGRVKITRAKGGEATAEVATYYQEKGKMVLTGNPTVRQGNDLVKGDRITIFLNEDRTIVEGSEDKKVSVTISPRREKR